MSSCEHPRARRLETADGCPAGARRQDCRAGRGAADGECSPRRRRPTPSDPWPVGRAPNISKRSKCRAPPSRRQRRRSATASASSTSTAAATPRSAAGSSRSGADLRSRHPRPDPRRRAGPREARRADDSTIAAGQCWSCPMSGPTPMSERVRCFAWRISRGAARAALRRPAAPRQGCEALVVEVARKSDQRDEFADRLVANLATHWRQGALPALRRRRGRGDGHAAQRRFRSRGRLAGDRRLRSRNAVALRPRRRHPAHPRAYDRAGAVLALSGRGPRPEASATLPYPALQASQSRQHPRQSLGQVLRDQPRTERPRRRAVQPDRRGGRLEGRHALRREAGDEPVSTSPEPAVASVGGRSQPIAARPSGAATTVSAPLRTTTAPVSQAAARARASLSSSARTPSAAANSRANSPSCGVMTAACPPRY